MRLYPGSITDIAGIRVGCSDSEAEMTGCTMVLFDRLFVAGCDVRGGGPGTLQTDILSPLAGGLADGVMLAGGSAFGLCSVEGAMRWLEEQGRGFDTGLKRIPLVPGAIIFDLGVGDKDARPGARMGYAACVAASRRVEQGSYGAGTGATVGKLLLGRGMDKGGQGTAAVELGAGLTVGALMVVNALGDVYEGETIIAGLHDENGAYLNSIRLMLEGERANVFGNNTTIGVVATNASLTPAQAAKMAMVAQDGLALAIRPVHTMADGDTVFAAASGEVAAEGEFNRILAAAAEATRRAIVNAALAAKGRPGPG